MCGVEPKRITLIIAKVDEWQALYVGGTVRAQAHKLSTEEILEYLRGNILEDYISFTYEDPTTTSDNQLGKWGNKFPELLTMIPPNLRQY